VHAGRERGGDDDESPDESGDAETEQVSEHESSFREGFGIGGERQVF
jgi:hypothetical protein